MKDFNHKVKMGKVMIKVSVGNELKWISEDIEGKVIAINKDGLLIDWGWGYGEKWHLKDRLSELEHI
jgi:hypothetical protein